MKDKDKMITAKAFGGDFPVCSEADKVAIEEGYQKAQAWANGPEGAAHDNRPVSCTCALIGRLLNGTATYGDMVDVGTSIARTLYAQKMAIIALSEMLDSAGATASHELINSITDPKKKEWIN